MAKRIAARAPGRVNLIGEHTDYNGGFVLPMALPFETTMAASARSDTTVHLTSAGFGEAAFDLDTPIADISPWARYIAGMIHLLAGEGVAVSGFDAEIATTIPVGASLSSSAALEVVTGFAVCGLAGVEPDPVSIAKLGQRVENEIIGIGSGIMDQLISAAATTGTASMIDCANLEITHVEIPAQAMVVILDTATRRGLVDSAYDERRASCERVAASLGVHWLRDADLAAVEALGESVDRNRARHVVTENQRVAEMVAALSERDLHRAGRLMDASHRSLSADFEVSSPALDTMVEIAQRSPGCFGARMTGGGFAGCAVSLVERDTVDEFCAAVESGYRSETDLEPAIWPVDPAPGASVTVDPKQGAEERR